MRRSPSVGPESAEENERLLGNPSASSCGGHGAVAGEADSSILQQETGAGAQQLSTLVIPVTSQQPAAPSTSGRTDERSSNPGISPATVSHSRTPSVESCSAGASSSGAAKGEPMLCRICLEEDTLSNLEQPCACTGTQKYAHHECIQRWVNEKGHLRCEICDQQYRGSFSVPPPGTAGADGVGGNMFAPMFAIRVEPGDPLVGPAGHHDRATLDFLDESDHYYARNPLASWCFTFVIFVMFLVVLHHTMIVADGMDDTGDGGSSSSSPPSSGGDSSNDGDYATSLSLLLFWIGTKAFLIGIPLYTVMRIAARQAQREQYEAMLRSTSFELPSRRYMWRMHVRNQDRAPGVVGVQGAAAPTGHNIV